MRQALDNQTAIRLLNIEQAVTAESPWVAGTLADPALRLGGGATHAGAKPRVPPNPVFSSDLGHLFFVTALTR